MSAVSHRRTNGTRREPTEGQRVWTDDYSNILGAVWRRLRFGEP